MKEIKKNCEIVKSDCSSEEYSDNYFANENGYASKGLINQTLAFSILKRNDNSLLAEIIELAYIASNIGLGSFCVYPYVDHYLCLEGAVIRKIDKKFIGRIIKKSNIELLKEEILKSINTCREMGDKVIYQERIPWQKKEFGKRYLYRKRMAIRVAKNDIKHIQRS